MPRVIGALCAAALLLCAPAPAAFAAPANGQLVAISRTSGGDRLVTLNPDGSGVRTILSGQRLSSPGWSPDGNRIVVADGHRVLVLDVASGQARTVLDEPGAAGPAWSPDGQRIALLRGSDVITLRVDGSDARVVPVRFFGQISWLSWSPDGTRLAYGTSGTLRTIALDGSGDRGLVTGTVLGEPAWSPDSARIAYRDDGRLRVVPAAGGEPADLTRSGGVEPDWSPDGREVVYAYGAGLRATTADGGGTRTIYTPADGSVLAEPDWQPCVAGVTVGCTVAVAAPACPESVSVTTMADQPVDLPLGGCTDPSGRPLTVAIARGPEHGTLAGARYTPAPGFSGQDAILYRASNGPALSNLARVVVYVLGRTVPASPPPPPPRAPYLSALEAPLLDRRGRGSLRLRCDADCSVRLRLVVRLRSRRRIDGPALERALRAGLVLTLELRGPARRLIRSAWVTGTVIDAAGRRRSFKIPVSIRSMRG
jgi:Tol biopolymer transport system component